jgi:hypothetical protein
MRVAVVFFQVHLVHMFVCVLGSVVVRVRVFVLEMVMLVTGVRMRVRVPLVVVFVSVRSVMTVLMVCHCHLQSCEISDVVHCALHDDPMWTGLRLFRAAPEV